MSHNHDHDHDESTHAGHTPEEIRRHVRTYISVFIALAVLTVVTVGVSYLHLPFNQAVAVALFIACIKSGLVAAFFMHLISEKKVIFVILIFALFFFLDLLIVPGIAHLF